MTDHPETIICLKMFEHYVAMSYYDYLDSESGECQAVKFKFRIYNILTKQKIVEKEKTMDEPIVSIKFVQPDKIILSTSSTIFVNVLRNDKTLELIRTSNFASKRTFLTSLSYLPEILPTKDIAAKQGYMLFGGSHGGLSFFVGKWIEEDKLKEQWF